jgi:glycosyltransferase involved in cell wall biosynthesis
MKIGVITNLYPPVSRGGAERVVQRIVNELSKRHHNVFVISTIPIRGRSALEPELREFRAEPVYRFFPPNIYHSLNDFRFPYPVRAFWHLTDLKCPASARKVEKLLRAEKPDIVLTHNLKGIGMRTPEAMRRLGIPFIHTVHDVQLSVPSGLLLYRQPMRSLERALRPWYERQVRKAIGNPNLVISPSQFLLDFYRERGFFTDTKTCVLPNPAPAFPLVPRGQRLHETVRLLYAGQLAPHKGIMQLLDAIDTLDIPIELHIAGEGTMAPYVTERAERDPKITHHGLVSTESLQNLLEFTDAVVVPSLCYENSPTIIYESLQSGVPVIASDIGGVGELIEHGKNGLLVEPGNVEVLGKTVRSFASQANAFWNRAAEIRASVAPHSMQHYVDELESLMNKAMSRH